tara:strand:+ start:357 stop:1010 length:654 start_codon:yes stop_codon:yes gene_type:complete
MIPIREQKEILLYNRVPVMIQDMPAFNTGDVFTAVQAKVPQPLTRELDYIMISDSDYLRDREVDSVYQDGIIYMSANIDDDETALLSVIHEIAHSLEEAYPQIYEDETIETEFLGKRKKMYETLSAHGFDLSGLDFLNAEYSEKFDDFLYLDIGYPLLRNLMSGLFLSPYAATSVREYFADAFEEYFVREQKNVKSVSPAVYFKIEELLKKLGEDFL